MAILFYHVLDALSGREQSLSAVCSASETTRCDSYPFDGVGSLVESMRNNSELYIIVRLAFRCLSSRVDQLH